jgi:hypothetical protein
MEVAVLAAEPGRAAVPGAEEAGGDKSWIKRKTIHIKKAGGKYVRPAFLRYRYGHS